MQIIFELKYQENIRKSRIVTIFLRKVSCTLSGYTNRYIIVIISYPLVILVTLFVRVFLQIEESHDKQRSHREGSTPALTKLRLLI